MNIHDINIKYDEVLKNLFSNVSQDDYQRLYPKVDCLKSLAEIQNRSIALYDVNKKRFILNISKNEKLLGYLDQDKSLIDSVEDYHSIVHADDLPFLLDAEIKMYEYLKPIRNESKKDYKLIYDYRVKSRSNKYLRFVHQMILFELDKNFNSWILLVLSDIINSETCYSKPRRFLINMKNMKLCLFNEECNIKTFILTKREKEILELISFGYDSNEIASILFVSPSTINNHRQHILSKTKTNNTTEAISFLKTIGLL